ncbi:REP element-mobilizing transposase RayT [Dyadobacter sp. BE34]|uniref:REP element-mobilizing transposase RayT n=1 Tax=Dyadobacter fermentans TaxID=94254 RepID=A0ABU1QSQ6_9BACT|nr:MULTISPECIES: IS200/IS605 family transposase [Dyadobacter]MDR6803795.1 REP element-mobilizing transposase RayT [Dyadobacter fermentans]MDR7041535.1 REP element-mobilizing transposase RayT [Dyadobacter sp. BE242]MDR7195938.1 REP element-mobilizing transposase RayT [Dyadobacter sp. BE34]MDR7213517.1 REP element-mobilizing transposase RayT [Dyadobacter sp. BE31]MDR7261344.1 REP element-mobilizing transposase RayT [Dyadobacter sp. BE32]
MANTYSQVHLHFIFAPKFRQALICNSWETSLYKYITGIVEARQHKMIAINGMSDHVHMLIGFRTTQSIADLMQDVKADSSQWINGNRFCGSRFEWQAGCGVFSYSKSQVPNLVNYIQTQKEHHRKLTFRQEYLSFLKKFEIEYDERYIFKSPE